MHIDVASASDIDSCVGCWVDSFAGDAITQFLLDAGPQYRDRLTRFFSLLMRARIELGMPVLVARVGGKVLGGAMGYATPVPPWPEDLMEDWDRFENATPRLGERVALYDELSEQSRPRVPHYYLGVIGVHPSVQGRGLGRRLLESFCDRSASDPLSRGVYLETANPANVAFYERAGFVEAGRGRLGSANLWCMFLNQASRRR